MYLFGFPEGLAGGSKETTYATGWDTSHTTNYVYTNYNTAWNTYRGTNRSTDYTRDLYTHSYNWTPWYTNYNRVTIDQYGTVNLRYRWWHTAASHIQCPALGVPTPETGYRRHASIYSNHYRADAFFETESGIVESTLVLPGQGSPPSLNEEKILNTTYMSTNYSSHGAFKIKIGPCQSETDSLWEYAITFSESLNLNGQLYSLKCWSFSPYTTSGIYQVTTSWNTVTHQTSRPTSLSTTHGTTYQTAPLTSHITYG